MMMTTTTMTLLPLKTDDHLLLCQFDVILFGMYRGIQIELEIFENSFLLSFYFHCFISSEGQGQSSLAGMS